MPAVFCAKWPFFSLSFWVLCVFLLFTLNTPEYVKRKIYLTMQKNGASFFTFPHSNFPHRNKVKMQKPMGNLHKLSALPGWFFRPWHKTRSGRHEWFLRKCAEYSIIQMKMFYKWRQKMKKRIFIIFVTICILCTLWTTIIISASRRLNVWKTATTSRMK